MDYKSLVKRMLDMDLKYRNNHLASALSALPIIMDVYETFDFDNDRFILSKGHACLALFAVLEAKGYQPDWSKMHPDIDVANGIAATTGSLGHGINLAIGMALAKKLSGKLGKVHVLMGDGECQEGSVWEGMLIADRMHLDNLFVHVDRNSFQGIVAEMSDTTTKLKTLFPWLRVHNTRRWGEVRLFRNYPECTVKVISEEECLKMKESL